MSTTESVPAIRSLQIAIIGNPNTGKSTLFNALAGLQSQVGNYPGVTVEKKIGRVKWNGRPIQLIDLPGTYSLSPRTKDEMVSVDVLLGKQPDIGGLDAVICIVDASNLERNLYLLSQILDLRLPTILVLNMCDVASERGTKIDVGLLQQRLGIPVITTEAHRRKGLDELRTAVQAVHEQSTQDQPRPFPAEFYTACESVRNQLREWGEEEIPEYIVERLILDVGGHVENYFAHRHRDGLPALLASLREELSEANCKIPMVEARVRYAWARELLEGAIEQEPREKVTGSDRLDRILTNRVSGILIFALLMLLVFQSIYSWAGPFMDAIEVAQGWLVGVVEGWLAPGAFRSLLTDGVIAGVGGVIIFLPQIVFLFLFIALMEDCGYMARAAFLMDRLMSCVGLSGKSFVPLMSSFACAIPGVMATRVIENRKDRMVTILVAPLMSCSARVPVYVLLIGAFIPSVVYWDWNIGFWSWQFGLQALVLFGMSSVGALVAIPVAWLLKKTFFRGETPPFVMELPAYKWPSPRIVLSRVYDRARAFVTRAGTLIFATTIVIWAAAYFPGDHSRLYPLQVEISRLESQLESTSSEIAALQPTTESVDGNAGNSTSEPNSGAETQLVTLQQQQEQVEAELQKATAEYNSINSELLEGSFLGRAGHLIAPIVKPLGWDWKIGVGALASFPAREVIIATLGTIYSLGADVDEESEGLKGAIQESRWPDGTVVYNVPVALSIMVFFALCAQCAATLMVIKRETNSWFWPAFTFCYMTTLAYCGAFVTYRVGMMF